MSAKTSFVILCNNAQYANYVSGAADTTFFFTKKYVTNIQAITKKERKIIYAF